jgi:3-hydroxyisobutyrate dehydrogenase
MTEAKPKIGFVGLGIMGVPMVQRLLSQGFEVAVWNLEPERGELVASQGAKWCDGPAAVRAASDIVIFCVLDGDAVEACCFGPKGIAAAKTGAAVLIDCSTIDPDRTRQLAERLSREAAMEWIDAPISGGPQPAGEGKLTIMAGGDIDVFRRVEPVLDILGANVSHMGPLGAGQTTKIINQALVGVNYVLMAEALTLAKAAGIDASAIPKALQGGMADSVILQRIYSQMAARDFTPPKAYARQLSKDLMALRNYHTGLGLDLPVIEAAVTRYVEFVESGNEMSDSAAISEYYAASHFK